jgi:hypothetical protein
MKIAKSVPLLAVKKSKREVSWRESNPRMHRSRPSQGCGGLPLPRAGTVMRTLDPRGASRGGEMIGRRQEGGEGSALTRGEEVKPCSELKGVPLAHARERAEPIP